MEARVDQQRVQGVFGLVRTAGQTWGSAAATLRHARVDARCDGARRRGGPAAGGDPVGLELTGGSGCHGSLQIEGQIAPWLRVFETDEIFRSEVSAPRPQLRAI